jgi:hypothetical protein
MMHINDFIMSVFEKSPGRFFAEKELRGMAAAQGYDPKDVAEVVGELYRNGYIRRNRERKFKWV